MKRPALRRTRSLPASGAASASLAGRRTPVGSSIPAEALPAALRDLFWSYDFAQLRLPDDLDLVMLHVLNYGKPSHRRWLEQRFGDVGIRRWILRQRGRGLTVKQMSRSSCLRRRPCSRRRNNLGAERPGTDPPRTVPRCVRSRNVRLSADSQRARSLRGGFRQTTWQKPLGSLSPCRCRRCFRPCRALRRCRCYPPSRDSPSLLRRSDPSRRPFASIPLPGRNNPGSCRKSGLQAQAKP